MYNRFQFELGETLYENPLASVEDVSDWKLEGQAKINSYDQKILLENELDPDVYGDDAHWVLWCPEQFPDRIAIEWEFSPIEEPGLCMIFFAANGRNGEDLFAESLPKREGQYPQYHSGAIHALHLSYFRHKWPEERAFRTCNLRKSHGFHLVAQAADPLPPVEDADNPYYLRLVKYEGIVQFTINDLVVLEWEDKGKEFGSILKEGKIGFRQMAPMKAAYANLKISKAIIVAKDEM